MMTITRRDPIAGRLVDVDERGNPPQALPPLPTASASPAPSRDPEEQRLAVLREWAKADPDNAKLQARVLLAIETREASESFTPDLMALLKNGYEAADRTNEEALVAEATRKALAGPRTYYQIDPADYRGRIPEAKYAPQR